MIFREDVLTALTYFREAKQNNVEVEEVDLVLVDLLIPGNISTHPHTRVEHGLQVIQAAKSALPDVPIVAMSREFGTRVRLLARVAGAAAFYEKKSTDISEGFIEVIEGVLPPC